MSERFDVFVWGFEPGHAINPVAGLAHAFGMAPDAAARLVAALPRVVRRRVPAEEAERTLRALERIGAHAELRRCPLFPAPVVSIDGAASGPSHTHGAASGPSHTHDAASGPSHLHDAASGPSHLHDAASGPSHVPSSYPPGGRITLPSALPPAPGPSPEPAAWVTHDRWSARTLPLEPPKTLRPARVESDPPPRTPLPELARPHHPSSYPPPPASFQTPIPVVPPLTPLPLAHDPAPFSTQPDAPIPAGPPSTPPPAPAPPKSQSRSSSWPPPQPPDRVTGQTVSAAPTPSPLPGPPAARREWSEYSQALPSEPPATQPPIADRVPTPNPGLEVAPAPSPYGADPLALPFGQTAPAGMRPVNARLPDAAATALQSPSMRPPTGHAGLSLARDRGAFVPVQAFLLPLSTIGISLAIAAAAFAAAALW